MSIYSIIPHYPFISLSTCLYIGGKGKESSLLQELRMHFYVQNTTNQPVLCNPNPDPNPNSNINYNPNYLNNNPNPMSTQVSKPITHSQVQSQHSQQMPQLYQAAQVSQAAHGTNIRVPIQPPTPSVAPPPRYIMNNVFPELDARTNPYTYTNNVTGTTQHTQLEVPWRQVSKSQYSHTQGSSSTNNTNNTNHSNNANSTNSTNKYGTNKRNSNSNSHNKENEAHKEDMNNVNITDINVLTLLANVS